jgi:hypothetical protein
MTIFSVGDLHEVTTKEKRSYGGEKVGEESRK